MLLHSCILKVRRELFFFGESLQDLGSTLSKDNNKKNSVFAPPVRLLEEEHRIKLRTFSSPLIGLSDVAIRSLVLLPTGSTGSGQIRLAGFQHSRRSQIVQSPS